MIIKDLFKDNIERPINPVIKVSDLEDSSLYQELKEYVVTREIDKNFEIFYKGVIKGFEGGKNHNGGWISGFFGCGKSHFLKIASILLQNREVCGKKAVDYFIDKPGVSPAVLHMMQEVGRRNIDTILFDIDSKSKRSQDEDTLVQVFMGVFNEKLGLCADPAVAHFERFLIEKNLYEIFKEKFELHTGKTWVSKRTDTAFLKGKIADALVDCGAYPNRDEALEVANSISKESPVSVSEFAEIVGQYCKDKGPGYSLFFMVDEVGQFISSSVPKMLKLQTITERLGTECNGQAWVVVTSQEDVEAVANGVSRNDFSKIQGRFDTVIKMSSSDVKEVIEKRLLLKTDDAANYLGAFYETERADIQNRLCMKNQAEIRLYRDTNEFVNTYPFIPYQYNMLQEMLTSLRLKSLSGKNLTDAARSMLRIFKETAENNSEKDTNYVTPLYDFYPAIEPQLDSQMRGVFSRAEDCSQLDDFDIKVLKTLFLVKYYDRLEKNLDNITALMMSSFNQNRLDLKKQIQESLNKLSKENFVQSNADTYMFLTNEEQEISREIKNETVDPGTIYKDISDAAFGSIFKVTSGRLKGHPFNRYVEEENPAHTDHELSVRILITDKVSEPFLPAKSEDSILFKVPNGKEIENAFIEYLRTENYVRKKEGTQMTTNVRSIIDGKRTEIDMMRTHARSLLDTALRNARIFINGTESSISDSLPADKRLNDASEILMDSVYSKHDYVQKGKTSTVVEQFLKGKTTEPYENMTHGMERAFADLSDYLDDCKRQHKTVTIKDVMDRFRKKPYGFETEDIQWMLAVLFRYSRIDLMFEGKTLKGLSSSFAEAKDCILTAKNYDKVRIDVRQAISQDQINHSAEVLTTLFPNKTILPREDAVVKGSNENATSKMVEIDSKLDIYRDHPKYPGKETLLKAKEHLAKLSSLSSPELFTYIDENSEYLRSLNSVLQDVYSFLEPDNPRRRLFDRGVDTLDKCNQIELYLDQSAKDDLESIRAIIESQDLKELPKLNNLCANVEDSVSKATEQVRASSVASVEETLVKTGPMFADYPELFESFRGACADVSTKLSECKSIQEIQVVSGSLSMKIEGLKRQIPKDPEPINPNSPSEGESVFVPEPKRNKKVMIGTLSSNIKTVESEEDIEKILEDLRKNLKKKLDEGPFDIMW